MTYVLKPYTDGPSHVVMGRTATQFLPDIEAYLAERELSTELAPNVAALMDAAGHTVERAVDAMLSVMDAYPDPRTP